MRRVLECLLFLTTVMYVIWEANAQEECSANTCGHGAKCVNDTGDCVCEYQDRNNDWIMRGYQDMRICVKVCETTNTRCPQNTECNSVPDPSGFRLCECAPGYNRSQTGQCEAIGDIKSTLSQTSTTSGTLRSTTREVTGSTGVKSTTGKEKPTTTPASVTKTRSVSPVTPTTGTEKPTTTPASVTKRSSVSPASAAVTGMDKDTRDIIIASVLGGLASLVLIIALIVVLIRTSRRRKANRTNETAELVENTGNTVDEQGGITRSSNILVNAQVAVTVNGESSRHDRRSRYGDSGPGAAQYSRGGGYGDDKEEREGFKSHHSKYDDDDELYSNYKILELKSKQAIKNGNRHVHEGPIIQDGDLRTKDSKYSKEHIYGYFYDPSTNPSLQQLRVQFPRHASPGRGSIQDDDEESLYNVRKTPRV